VQGNLQESAGTKVNLLAPFIAVTGWAVADNVLDWKKTKNLIEKNGLAGEKNPIMKFFYSLSPWAALAYKMLPPAVLFFFAYFHFRDIQNFDVRYVNADGVDKWALAWIGAEIFDALVGLYGYLKSN
jgi:Domain of unknown function (DUF5658)